MTGETALFLASLKGRSGWHTVTVCIVAALTVFFSLSFIPNAPLRPADVVIFVEHPTPETTVLVEVRSVVGLRDGESVSVARRMYQEGKPDNILVLESGAFKSMKGEFPTINTMKLPGWVQGRWCSAVTYSWWPAWSQREFSLEAQDVCFETSEYE